MVFSLIEKNDDDSENLLIHRHDFLSTKFTKMNSEMSVDRDGCQAVVINNNNNNNQKEIIVFGGGDLIGFDGSTTDVVESCYINNNNNNLNLNQQQWKQVRRRMPKALYNFAAVSLIDTDSNNNNNHNDNNYVYLYGGLNYDEDGVKNGCYKYDVINDTYTIMPPMKTKRVFLAKAVFKSKLLFAIGGYDEKGDTLDTLEYLDLSKINNNNKVEWQTLKVKMKKKRSGCCSQIINGILFVIGGIDENGNKLKTIEMYDLSKINDNNNKFVLLKVTMQTERAYATTIVLGYYILIIGGYDGKNRLDTIEIFNAKTLQFETSNRTSNNNNISFPTLSIGRSSCDAVLLHGDNDYNLHSNNNLFNTMDATHSKIFVVGGWNDRTTETIDIRTDVIPISKFRFIKNSSDNNDMDDGKLPTDINLKILSYL